MARHSNHRGRGGNKGRSDPQSTEPDSVSAGGSGVGPTSLHEDFWAQIQSMIDTSVGDQAITTGTVQGRDGGRIRVLSDEEDEPRQVGFPKHKGTRYASGERVLLGKTKGGRHVVLGTFTEKDGQDEYAVDNADLYPDSIDNRTLKANSVLGYNIPNNEIDGDHIAANQIRGDHIQQGVIGRGHIIDKSIGNSQLDANAVDSSNIKNNAIKNAQLDGSSVSKGNLQNDVQNSLGKADSAIQKNDLGDYAKKSDIPTDYIKKGTLAKGAEGTKELADKDWCTKTFQKKGGSSNS